MAGTGGRQVRVAVLESRSLIRQAILDVCHRRGDLTVSLIAESGEQFLDGLRTEPVGVLIAQYDHPSMPLPVLQATLQRQGNLTRVMTLLEPTQGESIHAAISSGIAGLVSTSVSEERFSDVIHQIAGGDRFVSRDLDEALHRHLSSRQNAAETSLGPTKDCRPLLTHKEMEVLKVVARGATIDETGYELNMSSATVKNHRHSIYSKLGVDNAPAAIYHAFCSGLLKAG